MEEHQSQERQVEQRWQGVERRQSLGQYQGTERRKPGGYNAGEGRTGVNAEEPATEQEEIRQQHQPGPNPRIPK
jgi:hypothetical protein